jgi:TonB-dependent receptor
MKILKHSFVFLMTLLISNNTLSAQKATLQGKITDGATTTTLIGATIRAISTDGKAQSASADVQGNFIIKNLVASNYTIITSYVSYKSDTIIGFTIAEGENKLNINLLPSAMAMKAVQVQANLKRDNANAIAIMQKNSLVAADAISSDVIRRSPDKNSGEILRRISGASLQDNKFAIIRGLSDRYNNAMINGALLPSTEPDRRAFSFDIFPASVIDNMTIFKTAAPDLTSEFAGGIIQITTKDIPDENFTTFSISQSYNTLTTFKPYMYQTAINALGFNNTDLPAGFPDTKTFINSTKDQKIAYSKLFDNDWQPATKLSAMPNASIQFNKGITKNIGSQSVLGAIASLSYNRTHSYTPRLRTDYETYDEQLIAYYDNNYKDNATIGALLNVGYKINNNHRITLQNTFNINAENNTLERTGKNIENEQNLRSTAQQTNQNRLINSQILGNHHLKNNTVNLKWQAGIVHLKVDVPNLRKSFYVESTDEPGTYDAYVPFVASTNYGGRFYSNLTENVQFAGADITLPFSIGKQSQTVKFGTYNQIKNRKFNARVLGYVINNLSNFNGDLLKQTEDKLFGNNNINTSGFRLDEITANTDLYSANAKLFANYIMFDNHITKKMRLAWGVRAEYSQQNLFSPDRNTGIDTQLVATDYLHFLPSFNFIYSLNDQSNLRISASKTLSRPEFREISPFVFYDFITASLQEGKPNLLPTNIYNADVRIENFAKNGQLLSMSLFYKKFINPIEQTVFFTGVGTATRSYINATSAQNVGIEIEAKRNFGFLPYKIAKDFGFSTNISLIYSRVDVSNDPFAVGKNRSMQGQSPFVANASVYYQSSDNGWSSAVLYNRVGNRIAQVGSFGFADVVEKSRNILDLQISKSFANNMDIRLTASDILRNAMVFYQDNTPDLKLDNTTEHIIFEQKNASSVSLNFSYRF